MNKKDRKENWSPLAQRIKAMGYDHTKLTMAEEVLIGYSKETMSLFFSPPEKVFLNCSGVDGNVLGGSVKILIVTVSFSVYRMSTGPGQHNR